MNIKYAQLNNQTTLKRHDFLKYTFKCFEIIKYNIRRKEDKANVSKY